MYVFPETTHAAHANHKIGFLTISKRAAGKTPDSQPDEALAAGHRPPVLRPWVHDLRWLLDVQTLGDRQMAVWGRFEEEQFDYLDSLIRARRPDVFLDIGAFAGFTRSDCTTVIPRWKCMPSSPIRNRNQLCGNSQLTLFGGFRHITVRERTSANVNFST